MDPFAELGDLEDRWKVIPPEQSTRAIELLAAASRYIRARKAINADVRIASGDLDPDLVTDIVCAMVQRVMSSASPDARSTTAQTGATSMTTTFEANQGGLRLLRSELETLLPVARKGQASSTDSLPASYAVREPGTEWPYVP